jgi:alpha-mannosidase
METHHFTYALYPHAGDWRTGNVIAEAMTLNHAVLVQPASSKSVKVTDGESLFTCTAPNLTLEAVKRSEDGKHLVIRLVERYNAATTAELVFPHSIKSAWSCNLMEETEQRLIVEGCRVKFTAKPYEIVTFRVNV